MKLDPRTATNQELVAFCRESKPIRDYGTRLVLLSDEVIINFGIGVTPEEARNQRYVERQANSDFFRVPKIHRFFQDATLGPALVMGYIVMEYIKGTGLDTYQHHNILDTEAMAEIVERIVNALNHLLQIPVLHDQAPGPVGGGAPTGYLWSETGAGTSFTSLTDMEHWLNKRLALHELGGHAKLDLKSLELSMCHTDLAPRNIILQNDGGIYFLDWAYAGFYPRLFEIYALRTRLNREPIFSEILKRLGPPTAKEEDQLRLLARVEHVHLRFGDSLYL